MTPTIEAGIAAVLVLAVLLRAVRYRPVGRRGYNALLAIEAVMIVAFIAVTMIDMSRS